MSDVAEVKQRLDIVQLIGESVQLKKAGRNFKGVCPFHDEKTPSFMVSPERQSYHCFGCGEGGDVFEFVMKREAVDFGEALRMLAQRAGVKLEYENRGDHKEKQRLFDCLEQAAKYFQAAFAHASGKPAQEYLKSRGITAETAAKFRIGYAPDDYDALVKALTKKKFTTKEIVDAGLAIEGRRGPYARFRGRLMVPIADSSGVVRGFTGRVLDSGESPRRGDSPMAKYVNSPETKLYHKGKLVFALDLAKKAIIEQDAAVLVEGQMDVISTHQAGTEHVVAVSGTAMTEEQLRQLTRFTKTLILALDNDAAGRKAMLRAVELVGDRDIDLRVADLGEAKDPDDLISKDSKLWAAALKEATPVIDFLLAKALEGQQQPYNRDAITAVLNAVVPVLRVRPLVDQDYYSEQLAMALGIEKSSVRQQLAAQPKAPADRQPVTKTGPASLQQKTPEELVTERMLGLVTTTPELAAKLAEVDERIFPELYQEAAADLKNGYTDEVSEKHRSLLDMCHLAAAEYEPMVATERAAEFDRLYARLKQLWIRQHQPKLLAAIKRAETSGDTSRRNRLMEEYTTLIRRITHG